MRNPTVLVADDEPANRLFAGNVLRAAGWNIVQAEDGEAAVAQAIASVPDLIIMDIDMPRCDGWEAVAAIRAAKPPICTVPILAFTAMRVDDAAITARGLDGRLPKPSSPGALTAAVAHWWPDGAVADMTRLRSVFGAAEMAPLVARFREQLARALTQIDPCDTAQAHRLAGVAGTLGFAAVSDSWLRLSEGDAGARDDARRDARLALSGIDRGRI